MDIMEYLVEILKRKTAFWQETNPDVAFGYRNARLLLQKALEEDWEGLEKHDYEEINKVFT